MRVLAGRVDERDAHRARRSRPRACARPRSRSVVDPAERQPRAAAALEDEPEQDDEHQREGQRPEHGRPVAGVAPDVGEGEREEGVHRSVRVSRAALDRSGRGRRPRASPAGSPRFWGSTPCASVRASSAPTVAADVARVEQDRVVVVLDRRDRGQAGRARRRRCRRSRRTGRRAP